MRNVCAPISVIRSSQLVFLKYHIECLEWCKFYLYIYAEILGMTLWRIFDDEKQNKTKKSQTVSK